MKKFFCKIGLFGSILVLCYSLWYFWGNRYVSKLPQNGIYVWGDSQLDYGLSLDSLIANVDRPVYSASNAGSGVYDFLVFVERVPANSTCVINNSFCCFFRSPSSDYNRSGVDIPTLYCMASKTKYFRYEDVHSILQNNEYSPVNIFEDAYHSQFPYSDTIVPVEPLSSWHAIYRNPMPSSEERMNVFRTGVKNLIDKGCKLVILEYPIHEEVMTAAKGSINEKEFDIHSQKMINSCKMSIDTLPLKSDSLLMYDYGHLNYIGAGMASKYVSDILCGIKQNRYVKIVID